MYIMVNTAFITYLNDMTNFEIPNFVELDYKQKNLTNFFTIIWFQSWFA